MSAKQLLTVERTPLRLYVHIPYCLHKCAYCDFNSHALSAPPWPDYLDALCRELQQWSAQPQFSGRALASIYFGGGTPSLAPPQLISTILMDAARCFGLEESIEISLEANPGAVDGGRFRDYRAAGLNRLSIGVQSFHDHELAWLERTHSAGEAIKAVETARLAGFDNINLDLMYGLPGQSSKAWQNNIQTALTLAPEHLSCYQLTVEPHTLLATRHQRNPLALPAEDEALQLFEMTRAALQVAGYTAYEVSNFARPGFHCRHNDGYWRYDDYIGIGAGACGKWNRKDAGICRYTNIKSPVTYMKKTASGGPAIGSEELRSAEDSAAEAAWLGLRRRNGIDRARFSARFSADVWTLFGHRLQPWLQNGQLALSEASLKLTATGLAVADSIALEILQPG